MVLSQHAADFGSSLVEVRGVLSYNDQSITQLIILEGVGGDFSNQIGVPVPDLRPMILGGTPFDLDLLANVFADQLDAFEAPRR